MIRLEAVSKTYRVQAGQHVVLDAVDLQISRGQKIGIMGRNGAGKSTLIRLISGAELPTKGRIFREMSVSWPIAFGGAFQGSLTGADNVRFICRVYGRDPKYLLESVDDFAELGKFMREPVKTYSSGMRARLAFAISMAIEFDCFLIDEVIAVGDARFQQKCHDALLISRKDRAMIMVSHEPANIRSYCQVACVLDHGKLHPFNNVEEAFAFYEK